MADSDSDSALSSAPPTEDEMPLDTEPTATAKTAPKNNKDKKDKKKKKNSTILTFFNKRSPSPPRRKRPASPPHDYVPEDNPDIAFIVMFRSRFNDAFPRGAPHVGPQDIELGVVDGAPSPDVEGLLCALLGLVLNRKKPVEKGHYGRALEEAIQTQKSQWPRRWNYINPLSGGRSFNSMTAADRITLLHTLCLWSLNQNEIVRTIIASGYKSRTTKDRLDTNIPLSVQPWGRDGEKRKYWLIEGQNDTHFRVYRETNPGTKNVAWWSVAGSIDELRALAKVLDEEDGAKEAKSLSERMINACPRFEASEIKRKRREYRISRSAAFVRPEPGFSLYEGRTRGKRQRYNFSDMEDVDSDDAPVRRSGRQSRESPVPQAGPTVTASGRQVRSRATGAYGETLHSGQTTDRASPATGDYVRSDVSEEPQHSRSTRTGNRAEPRELNRTIDSDEDDATSWDGGDEEDEPEPMDVDEDEDQEDVSIDEQDPEQHSLVVTLHYGKGKPDDTGKEAPSVSTSDPSEPRVFSNGTSNPPVVAASSTPALPTADAAAPTPFTVPTPPYTAPEEASKPVQASIPQEQMETLQIETQKEQTTAHGVTAGQ